MSERLRRQAAGTDAGAGVALRGRAVFPTDLQMPALMISPAKLQAAGMPAANLLFHSFFFSGGWKRGHPKFPPSVTKCLKFNFNKNSFPSPLMGHTVRKKHYLLIYIYILYFYFLYYHFSTVFQRNHRTPLAYSASCENLLDIPIFFLSSDSGKKKKRKVMRLNQVIERS